MGGFEFLISIGTFQLREYMLKVDSNPLPVYYVISCQKCKDDSLGEKLKLNIKISSVLYEVQMLQYTPSLTCNIREITISITIFRFHICKKS